MQTLIFGGTIVNEGRQFLGSLIIDNDRIADIIESSETPRGNFDSLVDATGCYVLPGVIDSHVHFREPGLTHKADISSESRAAAYGGVTTFFEMPNTNPQTTTPEALDEKFRLAEQNSHVNYSFFPGATNDNTDFLRQLDPARVPGIKLFMGSSTGNMLVDSKEALSHIFQLAAEKDMVLMAHCEDTAIINQNMEHCKNTFSTLDPPISSHPQIRSSEACLKSTSLGVGLAMQYGTKFHTAHVSTKVEADLFHKAILEDGAKNLTVEACVPHLIFTDQDYDTLGARIKCNPAVKAFDDRDALRQALTSGVVTTVSTDHAPHAFSEKQGGAAKAMSGMPMVQFSLPSMLTLADKGVLPITQVVQLMAHSQANLFAVRDRGYLRKGYKADVVVVKHEPFIVTRESIQSKCGWSPLEGYTLNWSVKQTFCNGRLIFDNGSFYESSRGEQVLFR